MSTLRLDTEAMRSHARDLDAIAESGREAVRAAEAAELASDALGGLCGPLINLFLGPVEQAGCLNARLAVGIIDGSADGLRDVADLMDATDGGIESGLDAMRRRV